jgi:peptidoglycan/LPS O-acetylase OafA/YrhL
VDVFFVLSGYLITRILEREIGLGRLSVRDFLGRRARRLMPALAVMLSAYVLLAPLLAPTFSPMRWVDTVAAALYLSNWREALWFSGGPLSHTWSLAVEGQFYLVWPLVLMLLRPIGRTAAAALLLTIWSAITIGRLAWLGAGGDEWFAYFSTPFHASGLVLGAALALRPATWRLGGPALVLLLGLAFVPHNRDTFGWAQPAAELAGAALIIAPPSWLAARPIAWVGKISYGIYLWHIPVWHALGRQMSIASLAAIALISVGLAAASYYGVEQRFNAPRRFTRGKPLETLV